MRPDLNKSSWKRIRQGVRAASPVCAACGTTANLGVDHIVPPSRGGTDDRSNLMVLCGSCNTIKGDRRMSLAQIRAKRAAQVTPDPGPRTAYSKPLATQVASKPFPPMLTGDYSRPAAGRYLFPVHHHTLPDGWTMIIGDYGVGTWTSSGCPPSCTLPKLT